MLYSYVLSFAVFVLLIIIDDDFDDFDRVRVEHRLARSEQLRAHAGGAARGNASVLRAAQ